MIKSLGRYVCILTSINYKAKYTKLKSLIGLTKAIISKNDKFPYAYTLYTHFIIDKILKHPYEKIPTSTNHFWGLVRSHRLAKGPHPKQLRLHQPLIRNHAIIPHHPWLSFQNLRWSSHSPTTKMHPQWYSPTTCQFWSGQR